MGRLFVQIAAGLPGVRVAAVADVEASRAADVAATAGAASTSPAELVQRADVDAVVVATPEGDHLEAVTAALAAGKHVLVEKPLAADTAEARQMVEAARQADRCLAVAHVLRFDPAYGGARRALLAGQLGELVHAAVRRNTSVGDADRLAGRTSIVDYLAVHDIDALQWVTGRRVVRVRAQSARRRMQRHGVDDAVQALLRLDDSGAWGSSMALWGTEGAIDVQPYAASLTVAGAGRSTAENQAYLVAPGAHGDITGIYRDELLDFVAAARGQRSPACGGPEGLDAVCVASAIKRALSEGGEVEVER
jgi:predicted dehydrogenase